MKLEDYKSKDPRFWLFNTRFGRILFELIFINLGKLKHENYEKTFT